MNFRQLIICTIVTLASSSCGIQHKTSPNDRLCGIWRLSHIEHYVYPSEDFPEEERQQNLRLYDDSVLYEVTAERKNESILLLPKRRTSYTLQHNPDSTFKYLEDDTPYPFMFSGDSAFTFQYMGYRFTYSRFNNENSMREAILNAFRPDSNGHYEGYLFTDTPERTLKARYNTLLWVISLGVLVLLAVVWYTLSTIRHKRKIEHKLRQLHKESQQRPAQIVASLRAAKEDFEKSDYYIELHRRITRGDRLDEEDWREMEQQVKKAYPDFVRHLLTLIPLSEVEFRTCLLIRLSVPPSSMAGVLHRDLSSISTIRSRLYNKVFGKKGSSHDWDEFILSL